MVSHFILTVLFFFVFVEHNVLINFSRGLSYQYDLVYLHDILNAKSNL